MPKAIPERLRDMCQRHGIYRTGSTSDHPRSVLKPELSLHSSREAPRRCLEAHLCDSLTVLVPPLGSVLRPWGVRFSVHFWFHVHQWCCVRYVNELFQQIMDGMLCLRDQRIMHRDLKTENILVRKLNCKATQNIKFTIFSISNDSDHNFNCKLFFEVHKKGKAKTVVLKITDFGLSREMTTR